MTVADSLPWLSAFIGGLLGSGVAWLIARKQIRASVVSVSRQTWINALRDAIAEHQGACAELALRYMGTKDLEDPALSSTVARIYLLSSRVSLLINPNETLHMELDRAVKILTDVATDHIGDVDPKTPDLMEASRALTAIAQRVLKSEWEVVKSGK